MPRDISVVWWEHFSRQNDESMKYIRQIQGIKKNFTDFIFFCIISGSDVTNDDKK